MASGSGYVWWRWGLAGRGRGADSAVIATEDAGKRMGRGEHEINMSERMLFKY
jgi:hypothetical protein